ncbi:MAG: hypothetical protein O3B64_01860 [bacterium]|nr:hypothetical protein [bacterium]
MAFDVLLGAGSLVFEMNVEKRAAKARFSSVMVHGNSPMDQLADKGAIMPFCVTHRPDLSIDDLLQLMRSGKPVYKTPHAGNFYPNNLALAALGIPMKLVDHNRGEKDKNFHPHVVVMNGAQYEVANPTLLSAGAALLTVPESLRGYALPGDTAAEFHYRTLRAAIPTMDGELWSRSVGRRGGPMYELCAIVAEIAPQLFTRYMHEDGSTRLVTAREARLLIANEHIQGLRGNREGVVIPNVVCILADGLVDTYLYRTEEVYSLSGPDMFRYIKHMQDQLDMLFAAAQDRVSWNVPETITMNMVNVSPMRFTVPRRRQAALDAVMNAYLSVIAADSQWNQIMREANPASRRALAASRKAERAVLIVALREALQGCSEILYRIEDGVFTSQYDLLRTGDEMYIHPWAMTASMRDIEKASTFMMKLMH